MNKMNRSRIESKVVSVAYLVEEDWFLIKQEALLATHISECKCVWKILKPW